ncbi:dynamin-binding protein isoform X1 [Heterocephalus glaber]|uniref:Dynamin-binding protein n=1 Tax=Heterocephalus glaber TaxID=10181 RepID=A0AAX6SLV4_HETGA|nr:dynamin-binding protein isoform X1 [Heterocephalus glaber]XP_021108848.1 dynamin-binding protein isoform X1 [Heterocephalus glaber]XP_021108849.1 dynamin-binding protein isoform X1 [Heterocephalus glaber]XP_021108850.1 dynamin-binding protein isoform X1 [Heterocephalus glaber]XP_021108851.1 dynamin-binding protein isoform X1 [Heterocephalus glaber]XP_021108852.1 dynamin-binding protein isoform X1 [Heterocephalus glaber]XP_021108853.1 dynamin-binding protein isoform X1 [Heterocephalus glabe
METGSVVRAVFDFCPSVSEELPLFVGDIIEVLAVVDEFWLLGKKEDVTGQFPSSFVEVVTIPTLKEGERLFICISEFTSQELSSLPLHRGDLVILNDDTPTADWLQGRSCWGSRGFFPSSCVRELFLSSHSQQWHTHSALLEIPEYSMGQARALMGLSAQLDEELNFREGDVITIIGVPEPGWFEGELEGRRGIFPEGFVELLGPLRTVDESITSGNQDDCVANGEVDMTLGEEEKGLEEEDEQPGAYGIALYRFQALEPNELDFEVGDKIRILATLEDGWLEGCLKGRTGIFPHRFVKLCPNARTEEPIALSQEGSLTKAPESSWDALENSLVAETPGHESHEYKAEETSCGLPENSTTLLNHLTPEYDINENSSQDEGTSGELPRSPGTELEKPPSKDSDMTHYLEAVSGVSSQPQVPFHSKLQKNQYNSTAEGDHQSSEQFSDLPVEARTRDYSTLPPRGTCAQRSSQRKPLAPLHRGSSLTASRVAHPNQLSPQFQGMAKCTKKHHTSKENTSSFSSTSGRSERKPGPQGKGPAVAVIALSHGDGSTDLDSKLTQQLIEFEKSLSASATEPDKILRHFSIMDFNSEKDIVRGSSKSIPSQDLPERRKALRPPPPRPHTPTSTSPHLLVDQSPKPVPPLPVRPSRPAPLPPAQQRLNAASPNPLSCHCPSFKTLEKEGPEHVEQSLDQTSPCPLVLVRIQEMEQDLDMYTRAQEELSLMLEEKQDASLRAETLEDLEFFESNIESLNLGLQQLREITPLSSQSSSLVAPSGSVSTENPEQRMLEKRTKVVEELLQTERDYIRDLEMCIERVMVPLQQAQVPNIDFEGLFGNMQMVIKVSKQLLAALEISDAVGPVFLDHRDDLEGTYKIYCQNHDEAISLLEIYEKDEKIQKHLQDSLADLKSLYNEWGCTNYINLGSFLIKPVQRVMRYPLLLMELLNSTPELHPDKVPLTNAVLAVKEINVHINEYKRRKDLVLKYRKGDEDSLMEKISKLNIHSIIKKSNRVSSHLKHLTGFAPQIKDEVFEETEKTFRMQERLIKSFIRDLSLYLQHIRESACVKVVAAASLWDLCIERGHRDLEQFEKVHRYISDQLFTNFKERTERLVISPLNQLLSMFTGPHKLVQKRFDKLLDFYNCTERAEKLKDKKTLEELQSARNNYEALNAQLLDELPKFQQYAQGLFANCIHGYAEAHCDFVQQALEQLQPLVSLLKVTGKEGNLIAIFHEEHSRVLQQLQVFTFFPESLPATKKPFERKTTDRQSARKSLLGLPSYMLQSEELRASLLARYPPDKLFQAERNFNAAQDLDVSLLEGDLVGVIKKKDPMGSQNRWLIDNGVTKGFVYSSFLKPYNPRHSHSDASVGSHSSTESEHSSSSPRFLRQNSNSTLTFNPSSMAVSFASASCPKQPQDIPSLKECDQGTLDASLNLSSPENGPSRSLPDPEWTLQPRPRDSVDVASIRGCYRSTRHPEVVLSRNGQGRDLAKGCAIAAQALEDKNEKLESSEAEGSQVYFAVYTFKARNPNELSVSANQRLKILEFKDITGNTEWWLAEVNGKKGYVPSNYIRKTEYT